VTKFIMSSTLAGRGVDAAAVRGGSAIFLELTVKWFGRIPENIDGNVLEIEFCGFEMMKGRLRFRRAEYSS
jgi:hypothetical protein